MSGGINMDEEKRRLQYMQLRAEQNLESQQKVNFQKKPKVKNRRDALMAACIVVGLVLLILILNQSGLI
jgi:hypothetical protein